MDRRQIRRGTAMWLPWWIPWKFVLATFVALLVVAAAMLLLIVEVPM